MFIDYFVGIYSKFFSKENKKERILNLPYDLDEEDTSAIKRYLDLYSANGFLEAENYFYGKLSRERANKIEPVINLLMHTSERKPIETKNNSPKKSLAQYVDEEIFQNVQF